MDEKKIILVSVSDLVPGMIVARDVYTRNNQMLVPADTKITESIIARMTFFGIDNPIHFEIGMGKGKFIHAMAEQNPGINYIGIEMYSSVLYRAIEKRQQTECSNLYFIRMDAKNLTEVFDKAEIDRIYLNFSDPWPKERHAKRRLTSPIFLSLYDEVLCPEGVICFKTDNRPLFDYSVETISETSPWKLKDVTYDLHHSEFAEGNIMTEYEEKFSGKGMPIHRLVAYR